MPQHSDKKQVYLIKKGKCFTGKEKEHTTYECLRKNQVAAISKRVSENSNSQTKE